MTALSGFDRRFLRALAPLPGLLLLLGLVLGGFHHHADAGPTHPCAVCTASHAPTVAAPAAAESAPARCFERVPVTPALAPRPAAAPAPSSRAPPLS
ncbi:MAG: hypothetical protein HZC42_04325 [Candidatus Eisenbacteria bacterium]|nr:hypothetical protein [Candidatus Eisenbacteria bacterium]